MSEYKKLDGAGIAMPHQQLCDQLSIDRPFFEDNFKVWYSWGAMTCVSDELPWQMPLDNFDKWQRPKVMMSVRALLPFGNMRIT